jgi:hypothetical protein
LPGDCLPQGEQAARCPPPRGPLSQAQDARPGRAHLGSPRLAMGWNRRECEGITVRERGMLTWLALGERIDSTCRPRLHPVS